MLGCIKKKGNKMINSLKMVSQAGHLEGKIGDRIASFRMKTPNNPPFGVGILKEKLYSEKVPNVLRIYANRAEVSGFDKDLVQRMITYMRKMALRS